MRDSDSKPINAKDQEVQKYREYVTGVADAAKGQLILNRSGEHASVIIEQLFRKAEAEVMFLTGALYPPIYGTPEVRESAIKFLKSSSEAKIHIIAEKQLDWRHPLLAAIEGAGLKDRVSLLSLPAQLAEVTPYHFAVADGCCYRLEADKNVYEAMVKFGEPVQGGQLRAIFANLQAQISCM
jgi:hypothetical protein